jgi:hypothetical protein
MNTHSAILSKCFRAEDHSLWDDFIQRFSATPGHVCYYPSAGSDFRPLVYQQVDALNALAEHDDLSRNKDAPPSISPNYVTPNLWLFSDYCGVYVPKWMQAGVQRDDGRTRIRTLAMTELYPIARMVNFRLNSQYVHFPGSEVTGRAFYLRLEIESNLMPPFQADVIYCCYENVNLIHQLLLRHQLRVSHLVWVCDGSGFGGGPLRHDFLLQMLPLLGVRWLFAEPRYFEKPARIQWPDELLYYRRLVNEVRPNITPQTSLRLLNEVYCEVRDAPIDFEPEPPEGNDEDRSMTSQLQPPWDQP